MQTLQQQKDQLEFILQAHKNSCRVAKNGQPIRSTLSNVMVQPTTASLAKSLSSGHPASSTLVSASLSPMNVCSSRPNSLPISRSQQQLQHYIATSVTEATGVPINTPSSGVGTFNFGLETIAEGHTGLTPLTGVPTSLPIAVAMQTSCGGEVNKYKRKSTDSSSSNELPSPTLVTL